MSDTIKVGDRVRWWVDFKGTKETPRFMTGTVASVHGGRGSPWAVILCDGKGYLGGRWVRDIPKLTKLDATALVQAVAAMPQDDQARESAISSLRDLVDDYDLAMAAGDLGGAEVGGWEYGL